MSAFHPYIRQTRRVFVDDENLRSILMAGNCVVVQDDPSPGLGLGLGLGLESSTPDVQPERSRRKRTTFSPDQAARLEQEYLSDCYMARDKRQLLAQTLSLSENQVKTWFQNRRAKDKRDRKSSHSSSHPQTPSPTPSSTNSSTTQQVAPTPLVAEQNQSIAQNNTPVITMSLLADYAAYLQNLGVLQPPMLSPPTSQTTVPLQEYCSYGELQ
ncbi:unnamed protein product [Caenorhabditis angaria]|uniref:Homeobox domain-containing protein n=1 Tax=Caenorhabditis angaria TaxID=860376 RepID=A0A9P1IGW6_9PELO|nr:unnamed protein product [Caenorhabditis angaria]